MIWVIWCLLVKSLLQAEIRKIHRSNEVQKREQVESRTKFDGIEDLQYDLTKQKLGLIALQRPYRNSGNARPIKCRLTNQLVRRWSLKWRGMTWPVHVATPINVCFSLKHCQMQFVICFRDIFWRENNWFWAYQKFIARKYQILFKTPLVLVRLALTRAS